MTAQDRLDRIADALRLKDADQRGSTVLEWRWITDTERTKWRELAMTAITHVTTTEGTAA